MDKTLPWLRQKDWDFRPHYIWSKNFLTVTIREAGFLMEWCASVQILHQLEQQHALHQYYHYTLLDGANESCKTTRTHQNHLFQSQYIPYGLWRKSEN